MPLDPLADLRIFVWPKMPLLLLSLQLTDVWDPHVSFFFNLWALFLPPHGSLQPSPAAAGGLLPSALTPLPSELLPPLAACSP